MALLLPSPSRISGACVPCNQHHRIIELTFHLVNLSFYMWKDGNSGYMTGQSHPEVLVERVA